jgi:HAD superfamily hydrolase (TIGR01458 family)
VFVLSDGDARADLEGVELVDDDADVVVLGGAYSGFDYATVNRVFRMLMGGAELVAMHRNLYWRTDEGWQLDGGAYVAGLEEATGRRAVVCGKPAEAYFASALAQIGIPAERAAMVGDDVVNDVLGAQALGLTGVLVRTGKFRPEDVERSGGHPDVVIDSIAELPKLLSAS